MNFDIKFRAFRLGDEIFINKLREDEERESLVGGFKRFVSIDRERKWVEDVIYNDSQSTFYFAVTEIDSEEIIGYVSIHDINYKNGSCFWSGIKLSSMYSGKGYGFQAALLITKYIFEEMRMVRCIGMCQENHIVMQKTLEKSGYKLEGILRKYMYKNGKYINECLYSIIDDEYKELKIKYNL